MQVLKFFKFALIDFPPDKTLENVFLTKHLLDRGHEFVSIEDADCLLCCDARGAFDKYSTTYAGRPKILLSGENLYFWIAGRYHSKDYDAEARRTINSYLDQFDLAFITNSEFSSENDSVKIVDFDGKVLTEGSSFEAQTRFHLPYAAIAYDLKTLIQTRDINPDKPKFCCFCATNGLSLQGCVYRDTMFRELSKYKNVESLGTHLNNVGCPVPREGFDKYVEKYKFMICFENSTADGYITEKIMRCLVSGVVPIYWGTKDILKVVNPKSFVFVDCEKGESGIIEAIERIKHLDTHDSEYYDMLYEDPLLNFEMFDRKLSCDAIDEFIKRNEERFISLREERKVIHFERSQWPGTENTKFVLQIMNCKAYSFRREMQLKTWCKDIPDYITWWHVIGDPTLKEAIYKPEQHLLIVPAPDTYEGLPHKLYQTCKFAYVHFPSLVGLIETDDDALIDMKRLMEIINKNTWRNYYGRFVHHGGGQNFYGYDIANDKSKLPKDGIKTKKIDYIVGCIIYLSNKALDVVVHRPQFFHRPIYGDLYLGECLEDKFKPEREPQLYGDKFDFEYPIWILNRQRPQVPNFFEKMEHYYNIFCCRQRYLISAENWPVLGVMKKYFKQDFEFVSGVDSAESSGGKAQLRERSRACPEGFNGLLILKKRFYIDFSKLYDELIQLLLQGDLYTNESYELIGSSGTLKKEKRESNSFELKSVKDYTEFSLEEFFDMSHESVFSEVVDKIKLTQFTEALRLCDGFFFDSQFYSSYYQAVVYIAQKASAEALSMVFRCLTLAETSSVVNVSSKARQEFIYRFILRFSSSNWTKEATIYFARRAIESGFDFPELYHELFFSAYGTHLDRSIALAAGLRVIENRKAGTAWQVWSNFGNFVPQLKGEIHQLKNPPILAKEYTSSSLAIANFGDVIVGILRTHTYRVEGTSYISNCSDGIIRTVNYYLTIDKDLKVIKSQEIELIDKKPYETSVRGLEDVRIVDRDRILGVTYEHIEGEARTMAYYELKDSEDGTKKIGDCPTVMKTPEVCEKNWLPLPPRSFSDREQSSSVGEPKFLYSLSPTRVVSLEKEELGIKKLWEYEQNFDDERGSSLLKYKFNGIDGYLVLTHRVIFLQTRVYLNRFFFLNSEYKILYASGYFYFLHIGIEYCLGLCYSFTGNGENLYAAVSKSDKETFIVEFSKETVEKMLRPIGQRDLTVFGVSPIGDLKEKVQEKEKEIERLKKEIDRVQAEVLLTNEELKSLKTTQPRVLSESASSEGEPVSTEKEEKQKILKKKIPKRLRYK